jgi:hypothetical protein
MFVENGLKNPDIDTVITIKIFVFVENIEYGSEMLLMLGIGDDNFGFSIFTIVTAEASSIICLSITVIF